MSLGKLWALLRDNQFVRSVSVLVSGAALAHVITAISLPILTRLYSPADFNMLAAFSSLFAIFVVSASLRFDVAIPLPESDADALNILILALMFALISSLLLLIPIIIFPKLITDTINQPKLGPYLLLLPVGVFLGASYNSLQCWFSRKKQFGVIAKSRIGQSATSSGVQIGLGLIGTIGSLGLLLGHVLNSGSAVVMLSIRFYFNNRNNLRAVTIIRMKTLFLQYSKFPKYSSIEALCNIAAIQVPIIIIAATALGPEAGYITLAMYVIQAPMSLIGSSISQVYLSHAATEHRSGNLGKFTLTVLSGLIKAGVGPIVFIGIISPVMFSFVFGQDWERAGVLVSWFTPWFIMQFLASPVSMALHVTNSQRLAMLLQMFGIILRVGGVYLASTSVVTIQWTGEIFALSGFIFYSIYAYLIFKIAAISIEDFLFTTSRSLRYVIPWIFAGLIIIILNSFIKSILNTYIS
jgi:O-antigen/teichoic acid export membrane protein